MAVGPSFDDRDPRQSRRGSGRRPSGPQKVKGRRGASGDRPPWVRALRIAGAVAILGAFAAVAALVGLFTYYGSDPKLPNLSRLDDYKPKQVTRILDRNGVAIGELGTEKRTVIPYDAIPKLL